MSMEDFWPRQSVHGWVLFLGIKSVYNDYKQQKWKKLLATAVQNYGEAIRTGSKKITDLLSGESRK